MQVGGQRRTTLKGLLAIDIVDHAYRVTIIIARGPDGHAILPDMIRRISAVAAATLLIGFALSSTTAQEKSSAGEPAVFETTSRLGRKLYALPDHDGAIERARNALTSDGKNTQLALQLSKAQAAKRQYREAVGTCTKALQASPSNAELYLERGHRELGLREFEIALADLTKAVELDPKQLDSHYHQGLAHYFRGEFEKAAVSFQHALDLAKNSDSVIDCANWLYVSRRRAGQKEPAAEVLSRITPDVKNSEPHLYFYLQLLHFYQGKLSEAEIIPKPPTGPEDIEGELSFNTINYGVGNWRLYNKGDSAGARECFNRVVKGYAWNSWGFIGSELELAKK